VCAGYAAAMQYLLQSVGIVCSYVISESDGDGCHAFNIVKLGKEVYYLDATWGDWSNTKTGSQNHNTIRYDYLCVPYDEFTNKGKVVFHIPRKEYYPGLETFAYTAKEYFRYRNAYLNKYSEEDLVRIFAEAAIEYRADKHGDFDVGIRFINGKEAKYAHDRMLKKGDLNIILQKASEKISKKHKNASEILKQPWAIYFANEETGTVYVHFNLN